MLRFPAFKFLWIPVVLLISAGAVAQTNVDVWSVATPTNPTNCTNTTITVAGQNDAANYILDPITFSVTGTTITVTINYNSGFIILPAFMPWTHSVNLGNLSPGNYNIVANGYLNNQFNSSATGFMTVNPCCPAIASFNVNNDTLCLGDTVTFSSTSSGPVASQFWLYGSTNISLATSGSQELLQAGQQPLSLVVTDGICSDTSTQIIEVVDLPLVNLGNDTSICDGSVLTKSVPGGFASYAWSDGGTGANGFIDSVGSLSVTVSTVEGCVNSDTVAVVALIPQLDVDLGADTTVCPEAMWVLDAGAGFDTYQWTGGETTQTVAVNAAGNYSVEVGAVGACADRDTIAVSFFVPVPVSIQASDDSCDTRELSAVTSGGTVMQWSTSETSNTIMVSTSGTYTLEVEDSNGCYGADTAFINIVQSPWVILGIDTCVMPNETATYTSNVVGTYLWSDGSTGMSAQLPEGQHWLQVTDENGCVGSDTVYVCEIIIGGINELTLGLVNVFPNPAHDVLTFEMVAYTKIQLFDLAGRSVEVPASTTGNQVDVSHLQAGHYILQLTTADGVRTARFVKQ